MFKSILYKHRPYKTKLILIFFVVCCSDLLPKFTYAQKVSIDYTSKHYTIHDGLAQMQVMSAFKDSRGYLWCNTKGGLSRFDGKKFKNYTSDIYGLRGNDILTFGEDAEGSLLIFRPEKITRLSGDSISHFNFPAQTGFYSLNKKSVFGALLEVNGRNKQNEQESQVLNYERLDSMFTLSIKSEYGPIIYFDEENENYIWQANSDSVYQSDLISQKVIRVIPNPGNINSMLKRGNELYAVSNKSEIYILNQSRFDLVVKTGLQSQYLKIIPTPDNTAFIIKTDKDLYYYKDKLVLIKGKMTFIRDILFDDEENLWVATEEGLYNYFQLNFVNYSFSMGNKDWVWSVIEDNQKNIWFASYQNGLWKWNGERVTDYTKTINDQFSECIKNKPGQPFFRYYMGTSKSDSLLFFPTETNVLQYNGHVFSQVGGLKDGAYQITKSFSDGMLLCGGYPGLFEFKQNRISRKWDRDHLTISSILNVERDKNKDLVAIGKGGIALIKKDTILLLKQHFVMHSYCST